MRKKLLLVIIAVLGVFGLVACGQTTTEATTAAPTTDAPTTVEGQTTAAPTTAAPTTTGEQLAWDLDATYMNYISDVSNLNPYSQMLAQSSTMYGYLTDSLYTGDYDWATAIADGLATVEGDFSAGAANLPYGRFPSMAAGEPVDVNGDGMVWEIPIRTDLEFEDGTAIDANTFEWSWKQLLDPLLLNIRASGLYDPTSLPILNAETYYKQNSPDKDEFGFLVYEVDGTLFERGYGLYGHVIGHEDWPLYYVDKASPYSSDHLVGPGGAEAYLEDWGEGWWTDYNPEGGRFFLETEAGATFMMNDDGTGILAPEAGWFLDGVELPVKTAAQDSANDWAGALPAYADAAGNFATVGDDGVPVGGVLTYYDAVTVEWSTVGIKATDDYTLELTLANAKTAWDVKGNLMSGITGVVHQVQYEAGMNTGRTQTTYGTIDNPLVSYGPYTLTTWEADTLFVLDARDDYIYSDDYRIRHIRYEFISDQSIAIEEFKAGRLDIVSASGDYFDEFKYSPYLRLSPVTTFFRFAFNVQGSSSGSYPVNPILSNVKFRKAFYYAIDRDEFASEVRAPAAPTYGFLGPVYLSTEYNPFPYRGSEAGIDVLSEYAPETYGYDPVLAKTLFDEAYDEAVTAEDIEDGDVVHVEYKFYDAETNWKVANWVKSTVENIFNDADSNKPKFILDLVAVSGDALDVAWDEGNFDMTFGGWQGVDFNAPSLLGQVYNSADTVTMLEKGFNTMDAEVVVPLPNSKAALQAWIADYQTLTEPTDAQTTQYDKWVLLLAEFDEDGNLTCTFDELFQYAYDELYNVADVNYAGKTDDFDAITAAMEGVLLDQMIAIPLFTSVAATVYSSRIVFEADSYHAWMGWGGLKYMYIAAE